MAYPARLSLPTIVDTAHRMVLAKGAEALTLGKLAKRLGVRPPSLYRHVRSRDDLLRAVNTRTTDLLFHAIDGALAQERTEPRARMAAVADAYRRFARAGPRTYVAAMAESKRARQPDPEYLVRMALPLQAVMAGISGEARSLTALRSLLALAHGFVMLELGSKLRRGGDLGQAYADAVETLLDGWAARGRSN